MERQDFEFKVNINCEQVEQVLKQLVQISNIPMIQQKNSFQKVVPIKLPEDERDLYCQKHHLKFEFICNQDQQSLCYDCLRDYIGHVQSSISSISSKFNDLQKDFSQEKAKLSKIRNKLRKKWKKTLKMGEELSKNYDSTEQKWQTNLNSLLNQIQTQFINQQTKYKDLFSKNMNNWKDVEIEISKKFKQMVELEREMNAMSCNEMKEEEKVKFVISFKKWNEKLKKLDQEIETFSKEELKFSLNDFEKMNIDSLLNEIKKLNIPQINL